jgi:hypothetical protein
MRTLWSSILLLDDREFSKREDSSNEGARLSSAKPIIGSVAEACKRALRAFGDGILRARWQRGRGNLHPNDGTVIQVKFAA